jgi:hypothetical protein
LGSDLGSITENLSLHILVNTSNGLLYENTFTLTPGQIEDINICAPTGCYEVLLEGTNWANLSDALVVNMFVNGLSVNQIGLTETLESMVGVLPVLSDCTISVNENTETSLEIFPNPVYTELNMNWVSAQNGANYRLLDQSGRIVLSGRMNGSRHTLDVSAVSSGLYILETSNGINLQQIRVAIEH